MKDLVLLQETIDIVGEKYPESSVFVRGDANASVIPRSNNKRDELFNYFVLENKFASIDFSHKTYHHFTNNGLSDSNIDVILYPEEPSVGSTTEVLYKVICGKTNPLVDSSHDVLISTFALPFLGKPGVAAANVTAPRVQHTKHKVVWSEEGIADYQHLLSQTLPALQLDYSNVELPEVASVLFQVTNHVLTEAAKLTNKSIELGKAPKDRKPIIPSEISKALIYKSEALKTFNKIEANPTATFDEKEVASKELKTAKSLHQNLVRKHNVADEVKRDNELLDLLSKQPKEIFKSFRKTKSAQSRRIKSLQVGDKTYSEETVADGFFDSISQLKTLPEITSPSFQRFSEDHRHIVDICKSGEKIPMMTDAQADKLLRKIRPGVSDFFSVTAAHYLNGGQTTIKHFRFLVNVIILEIELASINEMNTAHAIVLHKGHGKDKTLSSSYRTISSCPFIAKAVDIYLGDLSKDDWSAAQAPTQFQGHGMSHELASLLLTTAIQNSLNSSIPLFVLLLDAKSAFDLVLREILVRRLYLDTTPDQRIRFWDLRLSNRTTYCQWENNTMGPIKDELGLEQGGPNSSEMYKIYNNEQLTTAHESSFGTTISGISVASVGQADDTALISNDINQLQCLLNLSLLYCQKHQVQLSASKTKLLVFSKHESDYVKYAKLLSPLHIGNTPIPFASTAEHVGVLRSVSGNLPHIHQRMVNHKRSLAKILSMGLSKRHEQTR